MWYSPVMKCRKPKVSDLPVAMVRMPPDWHRKLLDRKAKTGVPVDFFCREAIIEKLKQEGY